jgi:hypothetical protein
MFQVLAKWLAPLGVVGLILLAAVAIAISSSRAQDCDLAHKSRAIRATPASLVTYEVDESALSPGVEAFKTDRLQVDVTKFGETSVFEGLIGDELVTLAIVDSSTETPALKWIETVPEHRRQGFASELLRGLEAHLGDPLSIDPSTEAGKAWAASLAGNVLEPEAPAAPLANAGEVTGEVCTTGSCPDCGEAHCPTCSEPAAATRSIVTSSHGVSRGLVAGQPVRNAGRLLARVTGVGNGNRAAYFDGSGWRPGKFLGTLLHNAKARREARQANRQARRAAR